jgi:hypothetical protein
MKNEGSAMKTIAMFIVFAVSLVAWADYWMTFCKTPGGQQYSQIGYVKPDSDGFVTIKAGTLTVVVYKTQVWYQKMPGEAPAEGESRFRKGSTVSSQLTGPQNLVSMRKARRCLAFLYGVGADAIRGAAWSDSHTAA